MFFKHNAIVLSNNKFFLNYNKEVKNLKNIKSWNIDNIERELDFLEDMILKIKSVEIDFFNKINNSLDFYNFYNEDRGWVRHVERIMYAACYSLKSSYRDEIVQFIKQYDEEYLKLKWNPDIKEKAELLLKLSLKDENLMIKQLKEWMRYSLVQLKLDKFYKDKLKFEI